MPAISQRPQLTPERNHGVSPRMWRFALVFALVVLVFVLWLGEGVAINTGDWDRATAPAGFVAPSWNPMQAHYAIDGAAQITNNGSVGVLLSMQALVTQYIGQATIATGIPLALFLCVALSGLFLVAAGSNLLQWCTVVPAFVLVLACYLVYLKSFYGEAVILACMPWLCVGVRQLAQHNRYLIFTLSAVAIVYAKQQMLYLLPLLLLLLVRNGWRHGVTARLGGALICLLLASAASLSMHPENQAPNQYNRYFNGLGWSVLNSASWPERRFDERHPYFYAHQDKWQQRLPRTLPHHSYLGTSYLPTASSLLDKTRDTGLPDTERSQAQALYEMLVRQGRLRNYSETLLRHPRVMTQLIVNTYRSTAISNYAIAYTKTASPFAAPAAQALEELKTRLTQVFGWIFLLALPLMLAVRPSLFSMTVVLWMAFTPLVTVMGDGFFEFEKHMTAFFILLPLAWILILQPRETPHH